MADEKSNIVMGAKKDGGQKKPSSAILLGAALVLAVLILGASYYWWLAPQPKKAVETPTEADLLSGPSAKILLSAFEKQGNVPPEYTIIYKETDLLGYATNITIEKGKNASRAMLKNELYSQSYVFLQNDTYMCIRISDGGEKCAKISGNGTLMDLAKNANKSMIFFGGANSTKNIADVKKLIADKTITFGGEPSEATVAGRKCMKIGYNYSAKGQADVWIEKCVDEEYGIFLSSSESRQVVGLAGGNETTNLTYGVEYTYFNAGEPDANITAENTSSENEIAALASREQKIMADVRDCGGSINTKEAFDKCIFVGALNNDDIGICMASRGEGKAELCALLFVKSMGKPELCPKAGSMQNDCYLEYAYSKEDASFCSMIDNGEARQTCLDAIKSLKEQDAKAKSAQNSTANP